MQRRTCAGRRKDGSECHGPAVADTDRCRMHLGRKVADVRVEAEARRLFREIAPEAAPVDNPLDAFAMLAGRVMAWLRLMDSLLDGLDSPRYRGMTAEQIRGEVVLYERAMDRANTVLSTYARLGIDDRLARVTERQGEQIARALDVALAAAGITPEQGRTARQALVRHLRSIGTVTPEPSPTDNGEHDAS